MHKGLLYLYAIIDVHSCYIVGWGLYSTLESENAIEVFERAIATYGVPEIINSDQGIWEGGEGAANPFPNPPPKAERNR